MMLLWGEDRRKAAVKLCVGGKLAFRGCGNYQRFFKYEKLSRKDRGPGEVMSTDENVKGTLRCSYFQIQWFLYL